MSDLADVTAQVAVDWSHQGRSPLQDIVAFADEIERVLEERGLSVRPTPPRWTDRHEVRVPEPCSLDRAFDDEAEPQRRELHALERDVLCRLLSDVLHRVRETRDLDALVWADHASGVGTGGVRLDAWEVPLLLNLVEVLQPRSEGNW